MNFHSPSLAGSSSPSSDINLSFYISPTGAVEVVVVVGGADRAGVVADVAAVGVETSSTSISVGVEPFQGCCGG